MNFGFKIYLLFIISWFLHVGKRIPVLGAIRFDFILIFLILTSILFNSKNEDKDLGFTKPGYYLKILFLYIFITLPFVQWPGSVLHTGLENFFKAILFYYFTIILTTTEGKLKILIGVFLVCQTFRVFEPVYLHITQGYWGSMASMSDWTFMNRLAGSPYDVVNPNGLAHIIVTIIPFLHYLSSITFRNRILYFGTLPVLIYALILTSSRSGFLALIVIVIGIVIKSQKRVLLMIAIIISAAIVYPNLSPNEQDRYTSLYDKGSKNYATSQGRFQGLVDEFNVAMHKPIVGHGLGTSREANTNIGGKNQITHNLYLEIATELGFVGLVIYLFFISSVIINFANALLELKSSSNKNPFLVNLVSAAQIWLWMNIFFSFASYGLSTYEWYLFGGLSVVIGRLLSQTAIHERTKILNYV